MKKTTVFTETKMEGKLNVTVTVTRTYGKEMENVNADGDIFEVEQFQDTYHIDVKLEGAINANVNWTHYTIAQDGRRIIDCGRLDINGKKRPVALTLECMDAVVAACHEQLTEEVSPEVEGEVAEIKTAIELGNVLPAAELKAKRMEYRNGMLEGGEGFNPYDYYVSAERVASVKSKYPKMF